MGPSGSVRVVVVDDHPPFLEVAREVILATPGFEPVAEVGSGEAAIAVVDELNPDLVLMDVHMPGLRGPDAARAVKSAHPETVVILISAHDPDEIPADATANGADALVRKQELSTELLQRVWASHGSVPAANGTA
jgi:DNA-binding NarL/FixJ family response regulator